MILTVFATGSVRSLFPPKEYSDRVGSCPLIPVVSYPMVLTGLMVCYTVSRLRQVASRDKIHAPRWRVRGDPRWGKSATTTRYLDIPIDSDSSLTVELILSGPAGCTPSIHVYKSPSHQHEGDNSTTECSTGYKAETDVSGSHAVPSRSNGKSRQNRLW